MSSAKCGGFVSPILALVCCAIPALAQSQQPSSMQPPAAISPQMPESQFPGEIAGTVVDGTGAAVVGARVTLTPKPQAQPQEVLTDADGQFAFSDVVPGAFQITIQAAGFAPRTSTGILKSGQIYIAPPTALTPANANTVVDVSLSRNQVAEEQIKSEEKQRVIGFIPNFYISYQHDAVPLGSRQKFELAWRTLIDPATFLLVGATAGIEQAQNDFSGYGQGAQGYAKRFGASYADNLTDTLIGAAILPSLLKQDPRYFYKGTGSAGSRMLYAVGSVFVCKSDNQRWQPNYSALLGGLASGGISNLYYPKRDRGAALTFDNALIGLGTAAGINVLQEFVIRKLTPNRGSAKP